MFSSTSCTILVLSALPYVHASTCSSYYYDRGYYKCRTTLSVAVRAIIGAVCAAVFLIVCATIFFVRRRKRQQLPQYSNYNNEQNYYYQQQSQEPLLSQSQAQSPLTAEPMNQHYSNSSIDIDPPAYTPAAAHPLTPSNYNVDPATTSFSAPYTPENNPTTAYYSYNTYLPNHSPQQLPPATLSH